ncbi:MAG: hypothetical protein IT323_14800 [Anaerolineae bacterium]|nr:hypothetical protein [Anaerolineae bacterium]
MYLPHLKVDFGKPVHAWDGFGVNYVEACQTRDYDTYPQEYGGFRYLTEEQRQEIIDLTFGESGLKPGVVKMFLDCWHQPEPGAGYDMNAPQINPSAYSHDRTTSWMLHFVTNGYGKVKARGADLKIIITLYGPPAWMTRQKFVRGRDLDPTYKTEMAKYMIAWAKHLREVKGLPVKYISVHNEGEDWPRWPLDGSDAGTPNHDYNLYWPPEQVAEYMRLMPPLLRANELDDVGVTPGECTGWYRFHSWGYAEAIADDPEAVAGLGLITSHGFLGRDITTEWFNDWRSAGIDIVREKRPDLHAWVTSTSWSKMDVFFIEEMRHNIYSAKANAIIPWACIQLQDHWTGGDPNPGTAFRVWDSGRFEVTKGYYFYKQVCRAGQPGMDVCQVQANDRNIGLIAFGRAATANPDAIVVLNRGDEARSVQIAVRGSAASHFDAYRTSPDEDYVDVGALPLVDGYVRVELPPRSVTTLFGS